MSESEWAGLAVVGVGLGFYAVVILICLALALGILIVMGIPYFRMAKRQGLSHAWLAFIPIGNVWVMFNLPRREFNLFNKYIQTDRSKVFVHYLLFSLLSGVVAVPIGMLAVIPVLGWLIYMAYIILICLVLYGIIWRINYDIYMTYGMEDNAMLFSILGIFFPIITIVMAFIIMNREPNFDI